MTLKGQNLKEVEELSEDFRVEFGGTRAEAERRKQLLLVVFPVPTNTVRRH